MKYFFIALISISFLTSCGAKQPVVLSSSTNPTESSSSHEPFLDITKPAPNKKYALTGENPVMVGEKSVQNQRRYIASLAGPNGEELTFHRRGSCCPYKSENGMMGSALVDIYEVTYEGLKEPILLYISFYDDGPLYIPYGFTKRNLN
ncbi:hypothetical protein A7A78_06330 [Aequorivita soesokkakensis]|jgi:hypothetical protein|uniref:2-dehydro-3-deoxyphosphooctonate aldolase n=2 Tax=Aequorivita soesokkakensis TaxID=1385699 RepID=A0A1A9LBK2_9FLAO|nr:hypothetical protein A7A78_06330 [Aequorivita soesokkakensis]